MPLVIGRSWTGPLFYGMAPGPEAPPSGQADHCVCNNCIDTDPPSGEAKPSPAGDTGFTPIDPVTDSAAFATPEASDEDLGDLLLEVLPGDGSTIGNQSAR